MRIHISLIGLLLTACTTVSNPYESSAALSYKKLPLPFRSGTQTFVRQGAFGASSHNEPGNQYSWDFQVPFDTDVLAVEGGKVLSIWEPPGDGGCDTKFINDAHNLKIEHSDGTVAQYVHVNAVVGVGQHIVSGQLIAHTASNGWLCYPHLHFGVYASRNELYDTSKRRTLPIFFIGIEDGVARASGHYVVP